MVSGTSAAYTASDVGEGNVVGIDMLDAQGKGGTNWSFAAQFAPRCNETTANQASPVGIFDIDYGVYDRTIYPDYGKQDDNLTARLSKDNRTDGSFSWSLMQQRKGGNTGPFGWGDVFNINHSTTTMGPGFDVSNRNLIELQALSYRNLVQLRLPFDQFDTLTSVGNACNSVYSYSCKASGIPGTMTAGQVIPITYTLTNTSSSTGWNVSDNPPEQYHRRVTVDGSQTANNFTTIPNNVPPGGSFPLTVSETVPAAGSIKVIYYEMWISTKGAMVGTPCRVVLSANSTTNGGIYTDCRTTLVWGLKSTAVYNHTFTTNNPNAGWWTNVPPSQWYLYPYPPGPPVADPDKLSSFVWWYQPPDTTVTETVTLPATIIPIKIHFQGSDGSSGDYFDQTGNPSGTWPRDTYTQISVKMGNFLKPHLSYTVTLFAQTSGSLGSEQQGPYDYSQQIAQTSLPQCLSAKVSNVCQGGSSVNTPVGQPGTVNYTIVLTNDTNRSFDSSFGYQMKANLEGGLVAAGPTTVGVSIPPGTDVTVTGTFNVISSFGGDFWVEFQYLGTRLANVLPPDSWDATCGPVSTTAYTQPYFQAWSGDVSAGGGFASPSGSPAINQLGSCGTAADSPYISPTVSGDPNSGGIRAFGKLSSNRGSRTDFGAIAMGQIPGSAAGDIGFFSADNVSGNRPVFANNTGNMGGYLNGGAPTSGCFKDFFTDTQLSPSNSSGNLQTDIDGCADRCQYISNSANYTIGSINFPAGKQVTLYVDGNVTINGDINYAKSFDPTNQANIPYLAIVARGNIVVTGNVRLLNGLYIAQPTGSTNGVFATCDDVCNQQLVVNGAVIAQHVELLRSHGTLSAPSPDTNGVGGNPAEIFNFVPSMIIGAPAFATQFGTLEGLFSLSPVF